MSHDANGIIYSTIAFLRSSWLKWGATCLFWLCDTICSSISIIHGTIAFLRPRCLEWDATRIFLSCDTIGTCVRIMWCWFYHQWHHHIPQVKIFKMRCNITPGHAVPLALALVSQDTNGIINGTITFLRLRQSNWHRMWLIRSCYAFSTIITWCLWHHQWHYYNP